MTQAQPKEHRLTLPETVDALVADGLIAADEAARFKQERRYYKGDTHPLIVIAEQRWKSLQPPHRVLDLDGLTQWLAKWCGLDYLHIDPLKINFSAVTDVMSNTYATRFRILPVEVKPHEVVIATAEPFQRAWEAELQPVLRKDIRRVISNPDDITRYLVEFYNLAKSIKGAMGKGDIAGGASNFEQLVELGKGNKQFDANDRHIVTIVDWLWQYAFEQRASDIHVEPGERDLRVRFRIDGVLHEVMSTPRSVSGAVVSPGVYQLVNGDRIKDALVAAGGLTGLADRDFVATTINLAARVKDGDKIYIPAAGGEVAGAATGRVNLNKATTNELMSLDGIGTARAQAIIDSRPYAAVADLVAKKVISQAIFEKIKDKIAVY